MNKYKKILNMLDTDKYLIIIFSGIIASGIGLVSIIVVAGIWYL